ncbi:MAG: hypothetical protein ACYSUX_05555 [Planctomycetota bacterium]|jgi:hypothetical protein
MVVVLWTIAVRFCGADFLDGLRLSLCGATVASLALKLFCSRLILVRVCAVAERAVRSVVRPIVLPDVLPTVPRGAGFDSRVPATFSVGRPAVFVVPIVLPIRDVDFVAGERVLAACCFFAAGTDGVLLPITVPMFRRCTVPGDVRLLFAPGRVEDLVELTAGCLAPVGAEVLRVPIVLPIRERELLAGCLFAFETDGVLRLLEPPIREAPLERAAGCSTLLGTDGLVVLIVLPIREVLPGLTRLLVLVVGLLVVALRELLGLDGVLELIVLPIRDVMLELIRPFELLRLPELGVRLVIDLLELLLGARLVIDLLELLLLGVRLVMDLLDVLLLEMDLLELLLGARLVMDLLDMLLLGVLLVMDLLELLLGARLVIDLLDMLLLGVRLVIVLLELLRLVIDLLELLLGARLVIVLLELLLLGVRLVIVLLELLLDEILLELLDDGLDGALGAGVGLETCRLELLDLLLDRVLAAKTGSENNKRANKMQVTKKSELSRRDSATLRFDFCLLSSEFCFLIYIIRLLSSAFTTYFHSTY